MGLLLYAMPNPMIVYLYMHKAMDKRTEDNTFSLFLVHLLLFACSYLYVIYTKYSVPYSGLCLLFLPLLHTK